MQNRWDFCAAVLENTKHWIFDGVTMTFNIFQHFRQLWHHIKCQKSPPSKNNVILITSLIVFLQIALSLSLRNDWNQRFLIQRNDDLSNFLVRIWMLIVYSALPNQSQPSLDSFLNRKIPQIFTPLWIRNGKRKDKKKTYWKIVSRHISIAHDETIQNSDDNCTYYIFTWITSRKYLAS